MAAGDLQGGFRLGDWLVEPLQQRIVGRAGTFVLAEPQVRLLLCLAEHRGEEVDRRVLAERAWPGDPDADARLAAAIADLQATLGDAPAHPHHLVPVGDEGYALIAHVEPVPRAAASDSGAPVAISVPPQPPPTFFGRVQRLVAELQRRQVFKVGASYLVAMWIVLQVAEVTFAPLHFPGWWTTALTILAILGLPIVIVLAWTYEITPGGIVVDTGDTGVGMKLPRARRAVAPVIVAGVTAMAGVTGLAWWRSIQTDVPAPATARDPGVPSIAVLPLVDMSPGGGNGYLGDGLSEELSMRLAQIPGLRVAARTSAFEFKDRSVDVRRIGQQLGVRHLIEGSVRRDGDSLRVTVQLIDARTGYHVWAGHYDRHWRDALALQDDIARAVSDALRVVLSGAAAPKPATKHALDVRAIDPYLEGLAVLRQPGDLSRLRQADQFFADAIAIDPSFAGAHAGLCRSGARRYDLTRDPADLERAERSCRTALGLDASLFDTEKALAALYVVGGKFEQATAVYRKLLERNPHDAELYVGLGNALDGSGQGNEAEVRFRQAVTEEPALAATHGALGNHLFALGRIPEATAEYRKVTELAPSSAGGWSNLGGALQMGGDFKAALAAYDRSLQLEPSKNAYSNRAATHFSLGQFPAAVRDFESALTLGSHDQVVWGNLGDALWQIEGRRGEAIEKYRQAIGLAEAELAATPKDPALRAQLGYYYGRVGDGTRSDAYLAQAQAAGPDKLYVQYYRALAAADKGDHATALQALSDLVGLGYPRAVLRTAPEFRGLRQDRRFKELVGTT